MVENIDISKILFLDIETVSAVAEYTDLPEDFQALWRIKAQSLFRNQPEEPDENDLAKSFRDRAAIYAEFGKIVCISVGVVYRDRETQALKIRLKSFASHEEKEVLEGFSEMLNQYYKDPNRGYLCGHNIKEFDVPYICRRLVAAQMPLPAMLDLYGKKPWETQHLLDTMELWKFGDRKSYTSLKLLAAVLGFPSPKDDIDGSMVGRIFWEESGLDRIAHYCEKDVLATAQLFLRFQRKPILEEEQVEFIDR